MADLRLGDRFDVVLLGTGLPESIVAAACARVGQSVLHLDRRDYYGGNWASFNLQGLQDWIRDCTTGVAVPRRAQGEEGEEEGVGGDPARGDAGETLVPLNGDDGGDIGDVEVFYYESEDAVPSEEHDPKQQQQREQQGKGEKEPSAEAGASGDEGSEVRERAKEGDSGSEVTATGDQSEGSAGRKTAALVHFSDVVKNGRRFNIDLAPNCLYARGSLVELLTKSQVSRYVEFKSITRLLTLLHGHVQQVPCSRADVFSSRLVSLAEKRLLMKLLELALHHEQRAHEYADFRDKPFGSFLAARQLTPNLRHFVVHSIAMTTEEVSTEEGLAATRRFLASLGRYGNTPFLFPLYGSGELPQCFCR
ncbi:rab proteins geranylgeranyltransferase component A 2-like [Lampetra planeri]